ncbi:hypothetical protein CTV99_03870 [Bacillus pumilus]|uniref:Uncharacterized protein n=1 Tax=Bacillus pumilus TaxID=1408 RepID=A0A2G8IWS0_BACPU|nr:hypothetical protein CTV99_03870 [Bacillus pumilus]
MPVLVLPRRQRFSITLKRRQRAKIKFILALCQQSEAPVMESFSFIIFSSLLKTLRHLLLPEKWLLPKMLFG